MAIIPKMRRAVEAAAERVRDAVDPRRVDADAAAKGWTVERGTGGRRTYGDPDVGLYAQRRRERIAAGGGDPIDQMLALFDGLELDGAAAEQLAGVAGRPSAGYVVCWMCRTERVPRYGMCDACAAAVGWSPSGRRTSAGAGVLGGGR